MVFRDFYTVYIFSRFARFTRTIVRPVERKIMNKKDVAIIAGPIVGAAAFFAVNLAIGVVVTKKEQRRARKEAAANLCLND